MAAVAGLTVCWYEHDELPCTTTDPMGKFVLGGLPGGAEVLIEYTLDGYIPQLGPVLLPAQGTVKLVHTAIPQSLSDTVVEELGAQDDLTKGHVSGDAFGASGTGIAGVAFALTPSSGIGPAYAPAAGLPTTTLDATESGAVLWVNVDSGEAVIDATSVDGSLSCVPNPLAWPGPEAHSIRVPVVAGYLTHFVHFSCD